MLGYPREDFLGKKLWEIGSTKDIDMSKKAFLELQDKQYIRYENMPLQTKDGKNIEVEFVSNAYSVNHHKVIQCNIRDITERKKTENALRASEERFKKMSFHDSMTGLYNKTYFAEIMARLDRDMSRSCPLSMMVIDIDGLKLVNDMFGHKAGDGLVIAAAEIISMPFRRIDIIARLGGDEFCVILPNTDYNAALAKKNEIARLACAYRNDNPSVHLNMSIGLATSLDNEKENIYAIYQRADDEMYTFKHIHSANPKNKIIDMLLTALAERDFIIQGHAERLSKMSEMLADRMHFSDDMKNNLILLANVHDLGKVSIPDKILFKPDSLTVEEREKMKEHSQIGYNIVSRSKELFHIADLVLHHHEFWNGKGYPGRLQGEQIPVECRLFSIMDAYDAMTNVRPYRKGLNKNAALEELKKYSGTQFDSDFISKFIKYIGSAHCS
jgi:diguanylate cyclase (GGDEF)-like protein